MANKRYVVRLSAEGGTRLNVLVSKGEAAAKTILKARILLKADESVVERKIVDAAHFNTVGGR